MPSDFLKILTVPAQPFIFGLLLPQQPHHKPLCPKYFVFQTLWPSSKPLTTQTSLSTQNICISCSFCLVLHQLTHHFLRKSSWVGPPSYTIPAFTSRLLCNVCELYESETGLACSLIYPQSPASNCWRNDWTLFGHRRIAQAYNNDSSCKRVDIGLNQESRDLW